MSATQSQLVLPILEALDANGGRADISCIYDGVAAITGVCVDERQRRGVVSEGGASINLWERTVRWSQQRAKLLGLIERAEERHWELTGKGKAALRAARPGIVITVYENAHGVALYGRCEDAVAYIDDASVSLILTSPPYPLLRPKQYGNLDVKEYIEWFMGVAKDWPRKLTADGSIVLNLGDVWERGRPTQSVYQERLLVRLVDELGLRLCQRFAWLNPSKLPAPAEWVTIRRVRMKPGLETIYWLSPHDHPFADNRAVLRPYSESMRARIAAGGEKKAARPSGYGLAAGAFGKDAGGSIPDNLLVAPNTESNSRYIRYCRENDLPVHPARFPTAVPQFFIKALTRPGDTVWDPMAGSLTTAAEAQELERKWIASEMHLEYLLGGIGGRLATAA